MNKYNILIIEDEQIICDYVKLCLSDYNVKYALNVDDGLIAMEENEFKVIICDILMKDKTGFDFLKQIKKKEVKTPVIMLTALDDEENLLRAYDLGAIDYLVKPVKKELLNYKVNALIKHIYGEKSKVSMNLDTKEVLIDGEYINLSKTEFNILYLLYSNKKRVYTKENIIDEIWFGNHGMSEKIIDVNIFNIRKKLKHYSGSVKSKRGVGYYFED